jgi:hypothetical protein
VRGETTQPRRTRRNSVGAGRSRHHRLAGFPVDREVFQNRPWGGGDPIGTNSATYSISRKKAASEASA